MAKCQNHSPRNGDGVSGPTRRSDVQYTLKYSRQRAGSRSKHVQETRLLISSQIAIATFYDVHCGGHRHWPAATTQPPVRQPLNTAWTALWGHANALVHASYAFRQLQMFAGTFAFGVALMHDVSCAEHAIIAGPTTQYAYKTQLYRRIVQCRQRQRRLSHRTARFQTTSSKRTTRHRVTRR